MFGLEGEVFGLLDNGILAVLALFGIDLDKRLGGNGVRGGLYTNDGDNHRLSRNLCPCVYRHKALGRCYTTIFNKTRITQ